MSSAARRRAAALQRYKSHRSAAVCSDRESWNPLDDALDDGQDDAVYDVLEEEDYRRLVETRRERQDFVVDDDGLGYHDDGEEYIGTEDDDETSRKRRRQNNHAALTAQALKKARRTRATHVNSNLSTDGKHKNSSMWDFVNRGPTDMGNNSRGGSGNALGRKGPRTNGVSVDALLQELDDDSIPPLKQLSRRRGSSVSGRAAMGGRRQRSFSSRPSRFTGATTNMIGESLRGIGNTSIATGPRDSDFRIDEGGNDTLLPDDDANDETLQDVHTAPPEEFSSVNESPTSPSVHSTTNSVTKRVHFADVKETNKTDDAGTADDASKENPEPTCNSNTPDVGSSADQAAPNPTRRRKLGRLSAAAQRAAVAEASTPAEMPSVAPTTETKMGTVTSTMVDAISIPQWTTALPSAQMSSSAGAGQIPLSDLLQKNSPEETKDTASTEETQGDIQEKDEPAEKTDAVENEDYLDMYWIDLHEERNGDILVFGKVAHGGGYVSCVCRVTGLLRQWFVLPKPETDLTELHGELHQLLHPNILPKRAGATWAGKMVERDYAFDDPTIPRGPHKYFKVLYDSQYPSPSPEICSEGGKHFSKILGAQASITENFLLKRKLMGPCWIRLQRPRPLQGGPVSWCKVETEIDDPKLLRVLSTPPPPPPLVVMALKFKTVVHPQTQKTEIVSLSSLCHRHVSLETATTTADETSPRHLTQLSMLRPLDTNGGGGGAGAGARFPRDWSTTVAQKWPQLGKEANERALLSHLLAQVGQWDPDVVVGHNVWGFDLEVLLSRCAELKIAGWSKLGRRRRMEKIVKTELSSNRRDFYVAKIMAGRLVSDTYLSAKELLLGETTYSLSHLAGSVLHSHRTEIQPVDIPQWYRSSKTLIQLAQTTLGDAQLVLQLFFRLRILPLTKQLTNIAGNLWSHTLKSNRAERTEYLLLHEFHRLKYLPPEKRRGKGKQGGRKAKYSGGLVLEPKKGLYDSFILLLDFNSLYPSIIQEYNLCFTTLDWAKHMSDTGETPSKRNADENDEDEGEAALPDNLPPLPESNQAGGVLPRVIKTLVERRKAVKKLMKKEANPEKKTELDIRQKAFKLTANSMYGCLGFSNSRFFAQPIAALVTAMGRETLQKTVDIAQHTVGLDVIYGDTDSIMINTRINDESGIGQVNQLGERVKAEVNKLFKTLEIDIDGIFRSMLLLKKKKYAAKTVEEVRDGKITKFGQELKGLDLVRRDWCVQSKETGRFVTNQILSGQDRETVTTLIFNHLETLANKMRSGSLPLDKYVITKGLSKHPKDYPDAKSQPHVQVAKQMLENNRPVNTGDHIPYIITKAASQAASDGNGKQKLASAAERARHPEEVLRSKGSLEPDVEWYLTQQILPPVSRLCDPIDEIAPQFLAEKLGLDASKVRGPSVNGIEQNPDELVDYRPVSLAPDEERFLNVEKLQLICQGCGSKQDFPGVVRLDEQSGGDNFALSGLYCTKSACSNPSLFGCTNHHECLTLLHNTCSIWLHGLSRRYYQGIMRCDEPSCHLETRQLSVIGSVCLRNGCNGRLQKLDNEREIHTHLKYLGTLFDIDHAQQQLKMSGKAIKGENDLRKVIPRHDQVVFEVLHSGAQQALESDSFNWISRSFWEKLFQVKARQ